MLNGDSLFKNSMIMSSVKGIIQCGASIGEEIPKWSENNIQNQILIEPISDLFPILEQKAAQQNFSNVKCFNCAISDYNGTSKFHISTDSFCSSSLLEFEKSATSYGTTLQTSNIVSVPVYTLDFLFQKEKLDSKLYNLLFIDVQGSEYYVIKGAQETLKCIQFVFTEVNFISLYEKAVLFPEFNEYMRENSFKLVSLRELEGSQKCQGEALYFSNDIDMNFFQK